MLNSSNATNEEVAQVKRAIPLSEMMRRVETEPKLKFIYSGIKENSIGIVVGPSKSGKTMLCENLAMSIASGLPIYLGLPIEIENKIVLIISFEEHYSNRTERNIKQVAKLTPTHGVAWTDNFIVATEDMPSYISSKEDWNILADTIMSYSPGIVVLDSVTHMCQGIEESSTAQDFTKNLRLLSKVTNTTIIAIHHTHKMFGRPLTMDNIAGSRVLSQELDFMIGINQTTDGKRYIKNLAFRYAPNDKETVTTFNIDTNCWLNVTGEAYESKLLAAPDGRRDDSNADKLYEFLQAHNASGNETTPWSAIESEYVTSKVMSKQTAFTSLDKLIAEKKIDKPSKGVYKIIDSL